MVFNSLQFVGFFAVVYGLYRLLPHRAQNWLLLIASYWFYAAWDWRFLGLLIASTVVDYLVARYLSTATDQALRRRVLWISIGFNLGVLGFFKYYGFFAENLHALLAWLGLNVPLPALHVVLPIGISFYTFMTMSYVIDVYRREIPATTHPVDFALFVAYFPHLVAGPILRAPALLPQIASPRRITRQQMVEGTWLVGWGLFKKIFVADNLATIVTAIFAADRSPSAVEVIIGAYAFAFQIYGDFSGYSDIARGLSKWMGIELNLNFLFPYFVRSPQAFWRNWHISLSTWLRDYLYIPLGGNRGSAAATYRNLMITMVLGGLWHGAAWPYVLWGAYQGGLLVVYRWVGERWAGSPWIERLERPAWKVAGWFVMFHLTCYGWLLFRARSVGQIASMTGALVSGWARPSETAAAHAIALAAYATPLLVVHAWEAWRDDLEAVLRLPLLPRYSLYVALAYLLVLFGAFEGSQFIYFQF
jgi:D-alanyl-lipoteichoic acid acyltransferase DltB (MBOAT superfamily)